METPLYVAFESTVRHLSVKKFSDAEKFCSDLVTEEGKQFELVTPFGDEEENFFLNYAEQFWTGYARKSEDIKKLYDLLLVEEQNVQ